MVHLKLAKVNDLLAIMSSSDKGFLHENHEANIDKCRSCGALMVWGRLNGKGHPYNLDGTSHFATCPDAQKWRAKKQNQKELF